MINAIKGAYRLRNGIVVETGADDQKWNCDVKVVSIPDGLETSWQVGNHNGLLLTPNTNHNDPINWRGGAHGDKYDVVEKID